MAAKHMLPAISFTLESRWGIGQAPVIVALFTERRSTANRIPAKLDSVGTIKGADCHFAVGVFITESISLSLSM